MSEAKDLINQAENAFADGEMDNSEKLYRKCLSKIHKAMLLGSKKKAHRIYLHEIGSKIHDLFGCQLEYNNGSYWLECPVLLSHYKGGFSVGGSSTTICSICGKNIFECSHIKKQTYDNVVSKKIEGVCNICGKSKCEHEEGRVYDDVKAFGIIVDIDIDHIAMVEEPANPLCVIQSRSLSKSELLEMLPKEEREYFIYGETNIHCHHCLICDGNEE